MDKNINASDLHIYQDDRTGNYYYYNGKELVLLGNRTPKIGDRGDADFQEKENHEPTNIFHLPSQSFYPIMRD